MKRALILMTLATLALSAAACGNDGPISTGLSRDKQLSELTDADARTACSNIAAEDLSLDLSREQECTLAGVYSSETPAGCEEVRTACLAAEPTEPEPTEPTDCSGATAEDVAGCDATVGEFEDCLNAQYTGQVDYLNALSCDDAGTEIRIPTPTECQSIEAACPGLIDD